ncbi:hypothetical protein Rhopal_001007-T1 [Rhodotorula paludigena]|uniref:Beta-lactamase-related domain-containing protein n=1 Tax=Rhodotorula paludigena TaxID=86838 RepID=A0AAV5G664_9BASI|nr:hypothetical protein Rhopal_001007-T1 [Rhodotorula paludigena]
MAKLSSQGLAELERYVQEAGKTLPGAFVEVGTPDEVLLSTRAGRLDMLDPDSKAPDEHTIYWFASTTKLLTSLAALQLIEQGILSLSTPMSKYFPHFATPIRILCSIDAETGESVYEDSHEEITVATLLNQTSGFGMEFGPTVHAWKKWSNVGNGYTNSCKKENLWHVPPTEVAGKRFEYGNGSEWLGLLIQEATGLDLDEVLRRQIFAPLNMESTTFYPFAGDKLDRLFPLRWLQRNSDGSTEWQPFEDQLDLLKLPRTREEIDYPVGGGGIYTAPRDYGTLLRHLLKCHLASSPSAPLKLSVASVHSLFAPSLPGTELGHSGFNGFSHKFDATPAELDWSTGLCVFNYSNEAQRRIFSDDKAHGRSTGSAGWSGAPGIRFWMDPVREISCVSGMNLLPGSDPAVDEFNDTVEKLLYKALIE